MMYASSGFSDWEIGDVEVFVHEGVYHLFHLIIPNHDYIAHAVSDDGISWRRVNNALFVGNPGEWDDDMLWTMHVHKSGDRFYMYYTGLQRKDRGVIQKIGMAESKDLIHWEKVHAPPLASQEPHYESLHNNPRQWLSFRDPFFYEHAGESYLLMCARSSFGSVSRRGCVGLAQKINGRFELQPALVYPMVYDDVECPCAFEINGIHYLIGSIREDIKVRYWFAPQFRGEYHSFHNDVLLPAGNYAARVVKDNGHWLVYNFFFKDGRVDSLRVLPPPKQLDTDPDGRLVLKSFYHWEEVTTRTVLQPAFPPLGRLLGNPTAADTLTPDHWELSCRSGYEIFTFDKPSSSFIWEGLLTVEGMGKCGLVSDIDRDGNGYFISFDFTNAVVQIRAWGFNAASNQHNFIFNNIQSNVFHFEQRRVVQFKLIRSGNYIELSLNDVVKLTLVDYTYSGNGIGLYSASSVITLQASVIRVLPDPAGEYASQATTPG